MKNILIISDKKSLPGLFMRKFWYEIFVEHCFLANPNQFVFNNTKSNLIDVNSLGTERPTSESYPILTITDISSIELMIHPDEETVIVCHDSIPSMDILLNNNNVRFVSIMTENPSHDLLPSTLNFQAYLDNRDFTAYATVEYILNDELSFNPSLNEYLQSTKIAYNHFEKVYTNVYRTFNAIVTSEQTYQYNLTDKSELNFVDKIIRELHNYRSKVAFHSMLDLFMKNRAYLTSPSEMGKNIITKLFPMPQIEQQLPNGARVSFVNNKRFFHNDFMLHLEIIKRYVFPTNPNYPTITRNDYVAYYTFLNNDITLDTTMRLVFVPLKFENHMRINYISTTLYDFNRNVIPTLLIQNMGVEEFESELYLSGDCVQIQIHAESADTETVLMSIFDKDHRLPTT